jgi:hypothetical protein
MFYSDFAPVGWIGAGLYAEDIGYQFVVHAAPMLRSLLCEDGDPKQMWRCDVTRANCRSFSLASLWLLSNQLLLQAQKFKEIDDAQVGNFIEFESIPDPDLRPVVSKNLANNRALA